MDQGYNLEAAELAEKAIKRLNVFKTDVEYLYAKINTIKMNWIIQMQRYPDGRNLLYYRRI